MIRCPGEDSEIKNLFKVFWTADSRKKEGCSPPSPAAAAVLRLPDQRVMNDGNADAEGKIKMAGEGSLPPPKDEKMELKVVKAFRRKAKNSHQIYLLWRWIWTIVFSVFWKR